MKKSITFLVTVHNEGMQLSNLLEKLKKWLISNPECNTVVLDDFSTDESTKNVINSYKNLDNFIISQHKLKGDFSEHKNYGNSLCSGEYIFAIDADEIPSDFLLDNLNVILDSNPNVELYLLPRVNILIGLNEYNLVRWGWHLSKLEQFKTKSCLIPNDSTGAYALLEKAGFIINEKKNSEILSPNYNTMMVEHYLPIINWNSGDYQGRIYKNLPTVKWTRKLHEFIDGAKFCAKLPKEVEYSLIHEKTLERQVEQNMFYNTNWSQNDNVRK